MWQMNLFFSNIAQAEPQPGPATTPSVIEQFMPFVFILAIIYFLLIRPSQKRMRLHTNFVKNLKKGDRVLTTGGILGKIEGLTEQYVTLEICDETTIRVLRSNISSFAEEKNKAAAK